MTAIKEYKGISQYHTDGTYIQFHSTLRDAYDATGVPVEAILKCCKHDSRSACNYKWKFRSPNAKEVFQIEGRLIIAKYASIKEAADSNKGLVSISDIKACCTGKTDSAGGYAWEYNKDEKRTLQDKPAENPKHTESVKPKKGLFGRMNPVLTGRISASACKTCNRNPTGITRKERNGMFYVSLKRKGIKSPHLGVRSTLYEAAWLRFEAEIEHNVVLLTNDSVAKYLMAMGVAIEERWTSDVGHPDFTAEVWPDVS